MHQPFENDDEPKLRPTSGEATEPPQDPTPQKKKPGRPRALSFENKKQIAGLIQVGCSRRYAARYVGCSAATIINQMRRDPEFADMVRKAEVYRITTPLHYMREQITRSWRANQWYLSKMDREHFGRQVVEVAAWGEVQKLFQGWAAINLAMVEDEKLRKELQARADQLAQEVKRCHRQY